MDDATVVRQVLAPRIVPHMALVAKLDESIAALAKRSNSVLSSFPQPHATWNRGAKHGHNDDNIKLSSVQSLFKPSYM